ncbi:MOSC domain-containing protein [Streptomyces sp. TRM 70361]|uniref:MOSC domain-containing protein n=1 Tax=Streptomyces sp. TRM 70361 TaxID=3116553 RepID=UPI002E7ABC16|nr:MOSC domain-containing protein [Streptomyces sp. TRM 70361]MEE1940587.1 MOSC domain-containing protein [Streptomyces sp. TRM 70361]
MRLLSVNLARPRAADYTDSPTGATGIGKRPADGPVAVAAPGPRGAGGSGLAGDFVGDLRFHGGDHQAVYAYAREDLDDWAAALGRDLPNGVFGENLTTAGVDVCGALIGERWRVGERVVLEVSATRTPCRTFAGRLAELGVLPAARSARSAAEGPGSAGTPGDPGQRPENWLKRFTRAAVPGAYLRVVEPGEIRAGDPVEILYRPDHEVTSAFLFRALTTERELLPRVLAAGDALPPREYEEAQRYAERAGERDHAARLPAPPDASGAS